MGVPTPCGTAETFLVQLFPISGRIVDGQLLTRRDAFRNDEHPLNAQPRKGLKLTIGLAGMVDESGKVSTPALPDLIWFTISHLTLHDVGVCQTFCDQADVLPDCSASRKRTARHHPVVASVFRLEDLNGRILLGVDPKDLGKANTFGLTRDRRLSLRTQLADEIWSLFQAARIFVSPFLFIDLGLGDVSK